MKAIAVGESGRLGLVEGDAPSAREDQLLVRVRAISINRGEILRARAFGPGFRPGWDFAGVVERAGRSGPPLGARVAGYLHAEAWSELVAASPSQVAIIPDGVSYDVAASLPVAGLTALGALDAGGGLLGRRVLVTGASGGVGSFAANLAGLAGAQVTAVVRRPVEACRDLLHGGAAIVSLPEGLDGVDGPFDLIVETLGGPTLAQALMRLGPSGKCVTLGVTDTAAVTFDAERFFMTGAASLEGFVLFRDRKATPAEGLVRLLRLVEAGALPVRIGLRDSWRNIEAVADALISRAFLGKAVLVLDGGAEA